MIIAETARLIMRVLTLDDAEMVLALLNEPSFIENIGDKGVRDIAGAKNYLLQGPMAMQQQRGYSLYCCQRKQDGELIGISGLVKREGIEHPEVGFGFFAKYHRQGYGFESATAAITHAHQVLQITTLQAIVAIHNVASIELLTTLGFNFQRLITLPGERKEIKLFEQHFS